MEPIDNLKNRIREAYKIVCEYEDKRMLTDIPKEKYQCEQAIAEQWHFINGYLNEYFGICRRLNQPTPEDIRQIAAHFPEFLAEDFRQAYTTLRRIVPEEIGALDQFIRVLRELGRLHEHLNEWKEMHNLLQECITALIPLKGELESIIDSEQHWPKTSGWRQWHPCRTKLHQLEVFARDIRYIDRPFHRSEAATQGPVWMIQIAAERDDFETCLRENNPETIYDSILRLWDACYDALFIADKRLRDMVGQVYILSNAILRSVENDN